MPGTARGAENIMYPCHHGIYSLDEQMLMMCDDVEFVSELQWEFVIELGVNSSCDLKRRG